MELFFHALLLLLHPLSLAELTEGEGQSLGDTAALQSFETHVLGTETEVYEVLRDGVIILRVDVRDELQQGILQIVRNGEHHPPVEYAQLACKSEMAGRGGY